MNKHLHSEVEIEGRYKYRHDEIYLALLQCLIAKAETAETVALLCDLLSDYNHHTITFIYDN